MKGKTLVAYFSAEGTTAQVARTLAKELNADLFEIRPKTAYTAADLDWRNVRSRSSIEMSQEGCRPDLLEDKDLSSYDNVLIGFPIWWYVEPRIVDTFLEKHDFSGKVLVPFATSGGSGIEKAVERMRTLCPSALLKEGRILQGKDVLAFARTL